MNQLLSTTSEDLNSARALLRAGQLQQAFGILTGLLKKHPQVAEAHWLLAGLHFSGGDMDCAYRELQVTLTLAPNHAPGHALLGEVLASAGRLEDAEQAFRQALVLQPDDVTTATHLGYTLLDRGLAVQALDLTNAWLHKGHATPPLLLLQGRALLDLGRADEAAVVFERVLQIAPGSIEGEIYLATSLADSGRPVQAERVIRTSMATGHLLPESHFVLARALMAQRRSEEAIVELHSAISARPEYIAAQVSLCELVWMHTGDLGAACAELDTALSANPRLTALRTAKAKLLEASQSPARAIDELEAGLAFSNNDFNLCLAIAQVAVKCDPARALDYAQRALDRAPGDRSALLVYCSALLGTGNAGKAEAIAARLLQQAPNDGQALALRACAWRLLGDPRYLSLYDYRCVIPQFIDTPTGWPDREHYLADLAASLRCLHAYNSHPVNQSLRLGSQADLDFGHISDAALKAFPQAIDKPIRHYMEQIGNGSGELQRRNTGRYALNGAWSVRLRPHGHHVNHIHPDGWLSSACYVELPSQLDRSTHAGWIQFGQPPIVTNPALVAEHFVQPEPGLLVLFPSWMWHGTVPFDGGPDDTRLTIAFDVVPA